MIQQGDDDSDLRFVMEAAALLVNFDILQELLAIDCVNQALLQQRVSSEQPRRHLSLERGDVLKDLVDLLLVIPD